MRRQRTPSRLSAVGRRPGGTESQRRERLLDAALGLFAERGIANTTVAQVASAGGVTSAMVHYWFDTRERLLDAVVDERLMPLIQAVWDSVDLKRGGALDLVRTLLLRMLDLTEEMPWLPALWLREIVQEGGLLRERVLRRIPRERNAAFRRNIARAQARGEISPQIMPELLFFSMLGMVMLPLATAKSWRRINPDMDFALDRPRLESHVLTLLMHGLGGTAAARAAPARRSSE
jgi:AcrR family transcriptional regulator